MRPRPPCFGCNIRSELCHGSCEGYKAFRAELERVKAEERKTNPVDKYTIEQIYKRTRYNFIKGEKQNRKRFLKEVRTWLTKKKHRLM